MTLVPAVLATLFPPLPEVQHGSQPGSDPQGCQSPVPRGQCALLAPVACALLLFEEHSLHLPVAGSSSVIFLISLSTGPLNVLPWLHSFLGLSSFFYCPADTASLGDVRYLDSFSCLPPNSSEPTPPPGTCKCLPSCPLTGATRLIASRLPSTQHAAERPHATPCSAQPRPAVTALPSDGASASPSPSPSPARPCSPGPPGASPGGALSASSSLPSGLLPERCCQQGNQNTLAFHSGSYLASLLTTHHILSQRPPL